MVTAKRIDVVHKKSTNHLLKYYKIDYDRNGIKINHIQLNYKLFTTFVKCSLIFRSNYVVSNRKKRLEKNFLAPYSENCIYYT